MRGAGVCDEQPDKLAYGVAGNVKRVGRLFYSHSDCITSKDVF